TEHISSLELPVYDYKVRMKIIRRIRLIQSIIFYRQTELVALDKLIKARFVEMFGSIKEEQMLGEISEFITVGIANSATHAYAATGVPMLRNQNIKENYLDDSDLIYITPEFAEKYKSKKLKENDIIAMRTGYPGIACLVPKKYEGCQTFTTLIVRLKINHNANYVCSYINSDLGKRFIDSEKVGVAQQNVGAKSLAQMPIKIASKDLQDKFGIFVQQVNKSKVVVQKALDEAQTLFDSLMQEYFG
ncbi:restriction endonuclease subunit S, partial [Oribacterium sinus]|uniref:restriction endonuclease subunit S n=1 Tax=Oribacterium sinus TaxID=237576 RepID=UPI00058E38D0